MFLESSFNCLNSKEASLTLFKWPNLLLYMDYYLLKIMIDLIIFSSCHVVLLWPLGTRETQFDFYSLTLELPINSVLSLIFWWWSIHEYHLIHAKKDNYEKTLQWEYNLIKCLFPLWLFLPGLGRGKVKWSKWKRDVTSIRKPWPFLCSFRSWGISFISVDFNY